METLPHHAALLYSELQRLCAVAAPSGRGISFVTKDVQGRTYHYMQMTLGPTKTQHYLGLDSEELRARIQQEQALWARTEPNRRTRAQLVAAMRAAGALMPTTTESRVFTMLERVGLFLAGGVVVGSQAMAAYANIFGVTWPSALVRTGDLDIAAHQHLKVGVENKSIDLRQTLLEHDMGFFEVPALERASPSTRFSFRGDMFSVDLLTPQKGKPRTKPVRIPHLKAAAQPVRFLDFLMADTVPAVMLTPFGTLVAVPNPARFAIHKLVLAQRRPVTDQAKVRKDLDQASWLLDLLLSQRPGDLMTAIDAMDNMPGKFKQQYLAGRKQLGQQLQDRMNEL